MKNVDLICGISSIGMPFTKDNKKHIGYYDLVKEYLMSVGYNVNGYNISSLNRNNTWDLKRLLEKNYNLYKVRNIQIKSIDVLRKTNFLFKLVVPKNIKGKFAPTENDKKIFLSEIIKKSENPIFLYSTGHNDFFMYLGAGPVEMMDSKKILSIYENIEDALLKMKNNIEENINMLVNLNESMTIYVLSSYYAPIFKLFKNVIKYQNKILKRESKYEDIMAYFVDYYNKILFEISKNFENVHYIDCGFITNYCANFDFHPTKIGNELIARKIIEQIDEKNLYIRYDNNLRR